MIYFLLSVLFLLFGFVLGVAVDFKMKSEDLHKPRPKPKDWHRKEHKTWKVDYKPDPEWEGQRN